MKQKKNPKPPLKPAQTPSQSTRPELSKRLVLLFALVIAALALVPYLNTLSNSFVLDDNIIIVDNPLIRDLGNVGTMFTTDYWSRGQRNSSLDPGLYRPLTVFTYAVDFRLGKLNPAGYHLVNVLLHAATSVLLFIIGGALFGSVAAAFAAAAIFAAHPVHTEAVTDIVGRAEVLAAVFYLLAFWFGRLPRSDPAPFSASRAAGSMAAAAVFYLLGLFSKETAATLPAVLLVDDWLRREEFLGGAAGRKFSSVPPLGFVAGRYALFAAAAGVYFLFRHHAVPAPSNIWIGWVGVTGGQRILTASRVLMEYIGLLIFPYTLTAEYPKQAIPIAVSLFEPGVLLSILLWGALGYGLWRLRNERALLFSAAWFFITILPISNLFFPIGVGKAERILYLPSAGFCLCAGWLYDRLEAKFVWKAPVALALAAILIVFSLWTWSRNFEWKDDLALAVSTLKIYPTAPLMSNRAGVEYHKRGNKEKAIPYLEQATREQPDSSVYRINLAEAYNAEGRAEDAIREFRIAQNLGAKTAESHAGLGAAYYAAGRIDEAIPELKESVRLNPENSGTRSNLGALYLIKNNYDDAARELDAALKLDPGNAEAHNNLGTAYLRKNRFDLAAEQYREALRLKPDYKEARDNLKLAERGAAR